MVAKTALTGNFQPAGQRDAGGGEGLADERDVAAARKETAKERGRERDRRRGRGR